MLKNKAFAERTTFLEENFTFLAQVLSLERKCDYGFDLQRECSGYEGIAGEGDGKRVEGV